MAKSISEDREIRLIKVYMNITSSMRAAVGSQQAKPAEISALFQFMKRRQKKGDRKKVFNYKVYQRVTNTTQRKKIRKGKRTGRECMFKESGQQGSYTGDNI